MNATARSLGMTHTRYTDPSGYDDATVSTAADQVRIVDRAMRLPVFASIVATPSATLPVAGTVHNTNRLLGHNGFVGVKTGSTAAAGGCFAFRAIRWIDGKRTTITGVVLGQPGRSRRVSRPPTPWSTASPVIGLRQIHSNQPGTRNSAPNARSAENRCQRNQHTRGETMTRTLRPLAALAMVALVAVISAGCGGTDSSSGTGNAGTSSSVGTGGNKNVTARDKAVRFSECMRANGVSAFPDPNASGELTIDAVANGSSLDTSTAAFEQAMSACRDLEPPGFTGHERTAQEQEAALEFAQCIRDHGVKDFPDPAIDEPLVDTYRIPSSATPGGMAILNAAMQKCDASAAGVTGGQ